MARICIVNWKDAIRLCPVCSSAKDGEVVLIGLVGTQEGHNIEAVPVHVECLSLLYDEEKQLIYQSTKLEHH